MAFYHYKEMIRDGLSSKKRMRVAQKIVETISFLHQNDLYHGSLSTII